MATTQAEKLQNNDVRRSLVELHDELGRHVRELSVLMNRVSTIMAAHKAEIIGDDKFKPDQFC